MTAERPAVSGQHGAVPWSPEPFPEVVARRLDTLDTKVRSLEDWRLEMRTAFRLLQLTFGTSVLAAVAAVLSLLSSAR